MVNSLIDTSDFERFWGVVLTYNTPAEKKQTLEKLEEQFSALQRKVVSDDVTDVNIGKGAVNCIDISGMSQILSGDDRADSEVMGWIKSRRVILLCKEWEWLLLQNEGCRWMSHLDAVRSISDLEIDLTEAVESLLADRKISHLSQRLIAYEYLENTSLFSRFLQIKGHQKREIQSLVEEKGLTQLDEDERDLLLEGNDAIYRYLSANELSSERTTRFNRQEFRDLFGEIPYQIGFDVDIEVFEDVIELLTDLHRNSVSDFTSIGTLTGVLTITDFESKLNEDLTEVLEKEAEALHTEIQELDNKELHIDRGEYITSHINQNVVKNSFNTLLATVCLERLCGREHSPLQLLDRYHTTELGEENKSVITRLLVHLIDRDVITDYNYKKIADFLEESGPKLVLLLDGLPLTHDSTIDYLDSKTTDERWEVGFGVTPTPSSTENFRKSLLDEYDLERLGGFTDDEANLSQIDLTSFFGERESELIELLNNDESVIVYDSGIDRADRFPSDVSVKIGGYWDKIDQFMAQFGEYADILVVSDHGLVETYEPNAVPIPDGAGKRGLRHSRPCFLDEGVAVNDVSLQESNISSLPVNIPSTEELCKMLNLNNPHAKFGQQTGSNWVHCGVSVEESITPFVIRRRS